MQRLAARALVCLAMGGVAIATGAAAGTARAQGAPSPEAVAGERFAAGEKAFQRGDYSKAGEAFEAAYSAKPHESALWNAARSWDRSGESARAANLYRRYLRTAPDDAPDRKRASVALEALSSKIGRLEIVAPGLVSLAVDGAPIDATTVFVSPGAHIVEAKTEAGDLVRGNTVVAAGATESVALTAPAPKSIPAPPVSTAAAPVPPPSVHPGEPGPSAPTPPADATKHRGGSPWILAPFVGLTLVSTTVLVASGIDVLKAKSDYDELKKGRSAKDQQQLIDDGVFKTTRTNVVIGITAGLAVVTGVVALTAIDWKPASDPSAKGKAGKASVSAGLRMRLGPGGASLDGRY